MSTTQIKEAEFDAYYGRYIDKLPTDTKLREGFVSGKNQVIEFFKSLPAEKLKFRYAPNKWNIKEILQHLIDTERIFMYRCFRIARNDKAPLTGYDQNLYIAPSMANRKTLEALLEEFIAVRNHSISLVNSLPDDQLEYIGEANGKPMSARAAAYTILGHEIWHMDIIKERYL